jgi:hypothetical protein
MWGVMEPRLQVYVRAKFYLWRKKFVKSAEIFLSLKLLGRSTAKISA